VLTFTTEWTEKRARKAARIRKLLEQQRAVEAARVEKEKMREFDRVWKAVFRERERRLKIIARAQKRLTVLRARIGMPAQDSNTEA